jgi:hypothetical protein
MEGSTILHVVQNCRALRVLHELVNVLLFATGTFISKKVDN